MSIVESGTAVDQAAGSMRARVLALEIETEGHHPGYVKNFAEAWVNEGIDADLDFLVTPRFFQRHENVVQFVQSLAPSSIRIHSLTAGEEARMERVSRLRYFHGWRLFCEYASRLNADHGLVMYSDFFQMPIVFGKKSPCPFSMIYFRPTFHYGEFRSYRPDLRETIRGWRKKVLLQQVLKKPELSILYCLDEVAVDYIKKHLRPNCHVQRFADSFSVYEKSPTRQAEIRTSLGIEADRRILMLLGVLDRRKGVIELLECLKHIPKEAAAKMCLLLAGKVHDSQRDEVLPLVARIQTESSVQLVLHDQYIHDEQVQHHFDMTDVVLATYQRHMGSSLALIRAAYAGKPVLSADYGLMGELVHRRKLGETVDTTDAQAMAAALERFATADLESTFDAEVSAHYARENLPEQLGRDLSAMIKWHGAVPTDGKAS